MLHKKSITPKSIISVILLLFLLFNSSGCSSIPIRSEDISVSEEYLELNQYVQSDLDECFYDVFPVNINNTEASYKYKYCYDCAMLGDPSYFIGLRTEFSSTDAYVQEVDRLTLLSQHVESEGGTHVKRLIIIGSTEDLAQFLDDTIQDGRSYNVLIVNANDSEKSIDYLYLDEYDNSPHKSIIRELIATSSD